MHDNRICFCTFFIPPAFSAKSTRVQGRGWNKNGVISPSRYKARDGRLGAIVVCSLNLGAEHGDPRK